MNGNSANSESKSISIDTIKPEITSITVVTPNEAQPESINFLVNFNEIVNDISIDDFELTLTNSVEASISSITPSLGIGSNVIVNVIISNPTLDSGTIRLDLKENTNLVDVAGNGDGTNGYVTKFTSGSTYELNLLTLNNSSIELKKEISIYYNNSNSDLIITSEEVVKNITIYEITGKLIITTTEKIINLNNLKTGIYLVNVNTEGKSINYKIVK